MPARYATNQRGRSASQRAGRRVGKAESKRLASYRVDTAKRSGSNGFPVRTTYPKGGVTEDGYNRKPKPVKKRLTQKKRMAKMPPTEMRRYQDTVKKVLAEQERTESRYLKKYPSMKNVKIKPREMPGWPDATKNQRRLHFEEAIGMPRKPRRRKMKVG